MSCSCFFPQGFVGLRRAFLQSSNQEGSSESKLQNKGATFTPIKKQQKTSDDTPDSTRHLIKGGFLYTMDSSNRVIENSWILTEGKTIVAIGDSRTPPPEYDKLIQANDKLIVPGFVNPHWHESFVAPSFEKPDDSNLEATPYCQGGNIEALSSMFGFIASVGNKLTLDEGVAIARWSMWSQLRSGTTTLGDMGSANRADSMANAAIDLGMRLRVSRWGSDIMIPNESSTFKRIGDTQAQANDWLELLEDWHNHPSGLIGGMPSVMGAFGSSDEQLLSLKEISDKYQAPYATHLAPLRNEREAVQRVFGLSPIERFERMGLLTDRLLAVHTAYASDEEYAKLVAAGVHICHAPAHYGMLGESTLSETRQLSRFINDGIPVSSSTDGDITYTGGMPEALRAAHLNHNEVMNDNTTCPPTLALQTGTINGAMALQWQHRIGSIEVGKEADLVMINIDDWRFKIGHHPLRTFLVSGGSKDVDTVMIAGKILVQDGRSTQFDEDELFAEYTKAAASARQRITPPKP